MGANTVEIILKSIYLVLFIPTYILYFINIHHTVNLVAESDDKFNKMSYIGAFIHISLEAWVHVCTVNELFATIISRTSPLIFFCMIALSHRKQLVKTAYITCLYFSVEACPGSSVNLLLDLVIPSEYQLLNQRLVYFIYNLAYYFVFTRFIVPRKDDLLLSIKLLTKKTYFYIVAYLEVFSLMISFVCVSARRRPSIDTIFFYLRLFIIPSCIFSIIIIIMLVTNSMSKFYYKRSAELLDKQIDLQARYYEKIDEMTTDIRKFRHDYKNHMHCLKYLLDSNKIDEAREYLDSISSSPSMNKTSFKSGNTIADAILNEKAALAAQENFRLDFSGVISEKISAFDICTILSNAIDNSLEACRRLKEAEDRYIEITCTLKNDMQMISISNPSDTNDPELKTSKENKEDHGLGLYNIKKAVDQLNGTVNIPQTSPVFVLDVMFRVNTPETA